MSSLPTAKLNSRRRFPAFNSFLLTLPPHFQSPLIDARSRLAMLAFLAAARRKSSLRHLKLARLLMPKRVPLDRAIHFSKGSIKQIAKAAEPDRLKETVAKLAEMAPRQIWPAVLAVECGTALGDAEFAAGLLGKLYDSGTPVPKLHAAQLAGLEARGPQPRTALSILAPYPASGERAKRERSLDAEISLIKANATIDDEAAWTSNVQQLFASAGLSPLEFPRAAVDGRNRLDLLGQARSSRPPSTAGPLVSVIVTCFKAERYIEAALQSLREQTHANIEILVVDDCSPDGSAALVEKLAREDSRIRLLRNQKNVGTYVSRNRAARLSRGAYVTTQDSDDWSHPERIEKQVARLESEPRAVADYCVGVRMTAEGAFEIGRPGRLLDSICYPSLMYRKSAAQRMIGYWDCVRVEADSEYVIRLTKLYGRRVVLACHQPLVVQLRREGSLTTDLRTQITGGAVGEDRQVYRAAARKFHADMTKTTGHFDFEDWHRPFPSPPGITVSEELVRESLDWD